MKIIKFILILLMFVSSLTMFSQNNGNKDLLEEHFSNIDSCKVLSTSKNYFIVNYGNCNLFFTFIFKDNFYINLIIEVGNGKKTDCMKYLELSGFKEDKRTRTWHYEDKIAYLLWDWNAEKWYISIYVNENILKS